MKGPLRRLRAWARDSPPVTTRQFLGTFALLFLLVTIALAGEGGLLNANAHRIREIQSSRVSSCRQTYAAFDKVFRPFFPAKRSDWTPMQGANWEKLNAKVASLQARCVRQVRSRDESGAPARSQRRSRHSTGPDELPHASGR